MKFNIITIFPQIFDSYFNESILKRAQKKGLISFNIINLRDFTTDRHKTVDDTPYGGGAGMVMKVDVLHRAIDAIKKDIAKKQKFSDEKAGSFQLVAARKKLQAKSSKLKTVLLSAKGKKWTQQMAQRYSKLDNLILICGRYEGVDERVKKFVDEEISIGDYVLTGGEIPAMAIVDSITRLLPGALGNAQSAISESHSTPGLLEYPQYTRPEIFEYPPLPRGGGRNGRRGKKTKNKNLKVPKILLSGNHAEIEKWRKKKSKSKQQ
jgi:tRNA (guanine37-N1)-methyltransferase